jgi:hypothetical protein
LKLAYLFVGTILLVPSLFAQQGQETNEAYSATAIGTGGAAGGRSIGFDVRITRYASDEEVANLAQLLKDKGQDALRRAMEKLNSGRISPVGSVGNQIAIARKRQEGSDTVITIVTTRIISFIESYNATRTRDLPVRIRAISDAREWHGIRTNHGSGEDQVRQEEGTLRDRELWQPVCQGRKRSP